MLVAFLSIMEDWKGNYNSIFVTLGATSHGKENREINDFYATEPKALELLLKIENFKDVWECACGQGHLSEVLKKQNIHKRSSDLINRGYSSDIFDFLSIDNLKWTGDIITNPPYRYAKEFVEKSLQIIENGNKVAMFLKIQFLESQGRKNIFQTQPPKKIYISSSRLNCAKNGDFVKYKSSAICYAWFVWEKGFKGKTIIEWFN